jgi:hypothetical protein
MKFGYMFVLKPFEDRLSFPEIQLVLQKTILGLFYLTVVTPGLIVRVSSWRSGFAC